MSCLVEIVHVMESANYVKAGKTGKTLEDQKLIVRC